MPLALDSFTKNRMSAKSNEGEQRDLFIVGELLFFEGPPCITITPVISARHWTTHTCAYRSTASAVATEANMPPTTRARPLSRWHLLTYSMSDA